MNLRPFTKEDGYAFAGAEKFGTQSPMICYDDTFVLILGGCPEEGCPLIFIQIVDAPDKDVEYCYVPLHAMGWSEAVQIAEKMITHLKAPDEATWFLVRTLSEHT
jgi:hypothetical protein